MRRYLIIGSGGQLAGSFIERLRERGENFVAPPESELDITDTASLARAFATVRPEVVLNCAAYNQVDLAESEGRRASWAVNRDGPAALAAACAEVGATLVHYSTDYVFDGKHERPYDEDDVPAPLGAYGVSKLAGEEAVLAAGCYSLVLRLSWVFGPGEQNFLYKLLQWSQRPGPLEVVDDQISVPTYTEDIVTATLAALAGGLSGRYHLVGGGEPASRYEVAQALLELLPAEHPARACKLVPVPSSRFPTAAQRPAYSAMSGARLEAALGIFMPHWRDAISRWLAKEQLYTKE